MATYYSDHCSGLNAVTHASDNTVLDNNKILPTGMGHGRVHVKRAEFTAALTDSDSCRIMQFKSGDRLHLLYITSEATDSAGAIRLGLYKTGYEHDGAVVDADVYTSTYPVTSARTRIELMGEWVGGGEDEDRGKPLWQFITPANTADPMEDWDLVCTAPTTWTSSIKVVIEAYYTSGD